MTRSGAYGFALDFADGDPANRRDLVDYDDGTPVALVTTALASAIGDEEHVDADRLVLAWRGGGRFEVRRDPPRIDLALPEPHPGGALVHPSLTVPMAVLARWRGDLTLHAGAFAAGGAAWAILGERTAGKSTMLATLARLGRPVVADDLLVVDGRHVWAGPRCVDLRPDAARRLPQARYVAEVGGRARWRMSSPAAPARLRLGGFFVLEWASAGPIELEPMPASLLLPLLYGLDYVGVMGPQPPDRVLDLLDLPCWRLRRPRDWSAGEEAARRLLEEAGSDAGRLDQP